MTPGLFKLFGMILLVGWLGVPCASGAVAAEPSAMLLAVKGKVKVLRDGRRLVPRPPQVLLAGDRVETGVDYGT